MSLIRKSFAPTSTPAAPAAPAGPGGHPRRKLPPLRVIPPHLAEAHDPGSASPKPPLSALLEPTLASHLPLDQKVSAPKVKPPLDHKLLLDAVCPRHVALHHP